LQNWLGICRWELGIRVEGSAASQHLRKAIEAYVAALQVRTREQLPQGWATTQNNLGLALLDQAGRSEGPQAIRLLHDAKSAYQNALEVYTEKEFPYRRAIVLRNLALMEAELKRLGH
jgi:hypothetical protein